MVALGLAVWMVLLGLVSIVINAVERWLLTQVFFGHDDNFAFRLISESWLGVSGAIASILFFFSIYWPAA